MLLRLQQVLKFKSRVYRLIMGSNWWLRKLKLVEVLNRLARLAPNKLSQDRVVLLILSLVEGLKYSLQMINQLRKILNLRQRPRSLRSKCLG